MLCGLEREANDGGHMLAQMLARNALASSLAAQLSNQYQIHLNDIRGVKTPPHAPKWILGWYHAMAREPVCNP